MFTMFLSIFVNGCGDDIDGDDSSNNGQTGGGTETDPVTSSDSGNTTSTDLTPGSDSDSIIPNGTDSDTISDTDTSSPVETDPYAPTVSWEVATALSGCGCNDATQVCGVEGACIPRCDDVGRCLIGVVSAEVEYQKSIDNSESFVMLYEPALRDGLDNPINEAQLWKFNPETGDAIALENGFDSVGTLNDGTFLWKNVLPSGQIELDTRTGTTYPLPSSIENELMPIHIKVSDDWAYYPGVVLSEDGESSETWILRTRLNGAGEEEKVISSSQLQVGASVPNCSDASDVEVLHVTSQGILYTYSDDCLSIYALDVASPIESLVAENASFGWTVSIGIDGEFFILAEEDIYWSENAYVRAFNALTGNTLNVYNHVGLGENSSHRGFVFNEGWGYCMDNSVDENIVGFPLGIGHEPIVVFPKTFTLNSELPVAYGFEKGLFAANGGLVSIKHVKDTAGNTVKSLLIQLPLPPKPCNTITLPCAGVGETCGQDRYCTSN
ncbi:MAG: hypothetical protein JXR76_28685 [Deltaproteobacteria bacterium]|nr:hypothetical protein [Deltaproteobacteria bacterium]